MKRHIIIIGIVMLAVIAAGIFFWKAKLETPSFSAADNAAGAVAGAEVKLAATVYKSPTCGCCGEYISYLKKRGFEVKTENKTDMTAIKVQYGIPESMQSCHTTVMGDYVVEGHIPVEAIQKLLTEKPDIGAIALPGMPQGSPGMPGVKEGKFEIFGLKDGESEEFMSL